jgi:hypothetical protein
MIPSAAFVFAARGVDILEIIPLRPMAEREKGG